MKSLTKALNRFILVSYDVIKNIAGAVMVAIIMIVSVGIVSRYIFSHAISWIEEICCLLLVWLCYLSASLTTVTKEHVVADFLSGSLPANMQKVLRSMIRIGEIIFFGVVTYSVILSLTKIIIPGHKIIDHIHHDGQGHIRTKHQYGKIIPVSGQL